MFNDGDDKSWMTKIHMVSSVILELELETDRIPTFQRVSKFH